MVTNDFWFGSWLDVELVKVHFYGGLNKGVDNGFFT